MRTSWYWRTKKPASSRRGFFKNKKESKSQFGLVSEPLYILSLQFLLSCDDRRLLKLLAFAHLLHELGIHDLALELLQGFLNSVAVFYNYS